MNNCNLELLPNLFIPGAGKSGTSSLHGYLDSHPQISMSTVKEPHFWSDPKFNTLGNNEFEAYQSLFNSDSKIRGESSTGYLFFEDFIVNIKKYYSTSPKFIIVLRNPIDRLYSHYWWLRGIGSETSSFKEAVLKDFDITPHQSLQLPEHHYKNYYQFGLYGKQIQKFYKNFGKDNIHIITSELLSSQTLETINSCFSFLGVESLNNIQVQKSNTTIILRYPWIYKNIKKAALRKSKLKQVLKPVFPKAIRKELNENLYPLVYKLTATKKKYPELSQKDRQWIKELYFNDISLLKTITNMDFQEWEDFLPNK